MYRQSKACLRNQLNLVYYEHRLKSLCPFFFTSENRVILEAVSRFENAYVAFAGWLTELEALNPPPMEVLPLALGDETDVGVLTETAKTTSASKKGAPSVTLPLPASRPSSASTRLPPETPTTDGVLTPDDVGEVMARGNACFLAIQTAAEVRPGELCTLTHTLESYVRVERYST